MNGTVYGEFFDVEYWLAQLEESVVSAEHSLRRRQWRHLGEEIANQRRCSHGLRNALESRSDYSPEARAKVEERVAQIISRRDKQLRRLEVFHAEVERRLRELSKFKYALREMTTESESIALNVKR